MKEDSTIVLRLQVVVISLLLFMGCGEDKPRVEEEGVEPVEFEVVGRGRNAQIQATTEVRISDPEEWQAYTDSLTALGELNEVDFEEQDVLLMAVPVPTGGYDLSVSTIERVDAHIRVEYIIDEPGEDCLTAQVMLTPFVAIAVEKRDEEIQYYRTRSTYSCGVRER